MSAFLVTQVTMDFAVAGIRQLLTDNPEFAKEASLLQGKDNTEIGRMLLEMNSEAIRQRYGDGPDMLWHKPEDYVWAERKEFLARRKRSFQPVNPDVPRSAIACLKYQCCEGSVPETPLYGLLDKAAVLFDGLVPESQRSEDTPWDHPEAVPA